MRLWMATLASTFALLLLGGAVHATGSSLACPDWPLCYGQILPRMEGGVAIEHSHRLLASLVAVLTMALAVQLYRAPTVFSRFWGLVGVVLVLAQATLGGITVLYRLPIAVSTLHLATAMLFFTWLVHGVVTLVSQGSESIAAPPLLTVTVCLTFLQLVVGAVVRHTGSGLACNVDVLSCDGHWLPTSGPQWLHLAHRALGVVVAALVIRMWLWARRAPGSSGAMRRSMNVAALLVGSQIGVGLWVVRSFIDVAVVTIHLGLGALLYATLVAARVRFGARIGARITTSVAVLVS